MSRLQLTHWARLPLCPPNPFPFPPGHTAKLHFPALFATRWARVTEFWPIVSGTHLLPGLTLKKTPPIAYAVLPLPPRPPAPPGQVHACKLMGVRDARPSRWDLGIAWHSSQPTPLLYPVSQPTLWASASGKHRLVRKQAPSSCHSNISIIPQPHRKLLISRKRLSHFKQHLVQTKPKTRKELYKQLLEFFIQVFSSNYIVSSA